VGEAGLDSEAAAGLKWPFAAGPVS
jgi:hypothetical protein